MLATVLHTKTSSKISIDIMRAFVMMRNTLANHLLSTENINTMLIKHDNKLDRHDFEIKQLQDFLFQEPKKINQIFYQGQIYDAYSLLMELLGSAEKEIILIDNYVNKELLDILRNIKVNILIVSKETDRILKEKYQSQYENITFLQNDTFHDRFIILDRKKLYSCGSSFKDLGKKCFAINEMNSEEFITTLLQKIEKPKK